MISENWIPWSLLQCLLQRAHLFFIILLFESTFVAHHGPFPLLLGTQPLCFLPPYVKGNTQSSLTPSSLPNVLPWPSALHMVHSPEQMKKNWLVFSETIKHHYSITPHNFILRMKVINEFFNRNLIYDTYHYFKPFSFPQYLLQRAHFVNFPCASTSVAHNRPFPFSVDGAHPLLYFKSLCMKGNLQFWILPFPLA